MQRLVLFETQADLKKGKTTCLGSCNEKCQKEFQALLGELPNSLAQHPHAAPARRCTRSPPHTLAAHARRTRMPHPLAAAALARRGREKEVAARAARPGRRRTRPQHQLSNAHAHSSSSDVVS
jgi:hypothetical protein